MNKKIISGLMIAFAVILPVSSANAVDNVSGTDSNYVIVDGNAFDYQAGKTITINNGTSNTEYNIISTEAYPFGVGRLKLTLNNVLPGGPVSYVITSISSAQYSPMSLFDNVRDFLTGRLLPAIAGLVVLGISVRLAIKAVRKFSKVA